MASPRALLCLIFGLALAGPASATQQWPEPQVIFALIDRIVADIDRAGDEVDGSATLAQLAEGLHLSPARPDAQPDARPDARPVERLALKVGEAGTVESGDLQIAMTQLSINAGTNNQLRVMQAQNGQRDALFVHSGAITLGEVAKQAETQHLNGLAQKDGVFRLTRPLIVWPGATLILQPGDVLDLSSGGGAFLLAFGGLDLTGAEVRTSPQPAALSPAASSPAASPPTAAANSFRPFIAVTGQGTLLAESSRFSGLGMVGADPFGGVAVLSRGLFAPATPPLLRDNRFDDLGGVTLIGVTGAVVTGNRFRASRSNALVLAGARAMQVSDNVILGTMGGAGLKVDEKVQGVQLFGNLISGGAHNGITLTGNSKGVDVAGNVLLGNAGTGLAVQRAACLRVTGNAILRSGAAGLRLNAIGATLVAGNVVAQSNGAAMALDGQARGQRIEITDNLVAANRVGLTGSSIGDVVLSGNDLDSQFPRLFAGEFSQHLPGFLTASQQLDATLFRIAAKDSDAGSDFLTACKKD